MCQISPLSLSRRKNAGPSGWLKWAGLAAALGYGARQPIEYPTPFEPTELIPFNNEAL